MRPRIRNRLWLTIAGALLLATPSHALDFSSGDIEVSKLGEYGFTNGGSQLSFDSGGTDELFQMYAYIGNANGVVRVDKKNFDIVSAITASANIATSTVTLDANGAAVLGLAAGDIDITYTFTLTDDTGVPDIDEFTWKADITNASGAALDLVFYSYLNLDLGGNSDTNDDSADADIYRILVTDPDIPGTFRWEPISGPADHFAVDSAGALASTLDGLGAATDLSDTSALLGPTDITMAFQQDLMNLMNGETRSAGTNIVATPEPGSGLLLALGLAGLTRLSRRRDSRSLACD